jgi:DNA (cytosine-5)-methyltransferase 1
MKIVKVGSDFSGVGAFDYAISRISKVKNFEVENIFACDMDKYARISYLSSHKQPNYYPENVYEREIPKESLDVYMTSPPCQSFSLAGKRKGKTDKRGVLFFNSHEFIKENKPRFFIFENVKGLLSDDGGNTFNEWVNMLGGKSVNGNPILFPYEDSVPYHLYFKVLNSKEHGVPQNRERIFLVGIRDDTDNVFQFPKEEPLINKLKDLLEKEVDEKYFLSDKIQSQLVLNGKNNSVIGTTKPEFRTIGERDNVHNPNSYMSCLTATDYKQPKQILVKSNTKKGFDTATENDSINFSVPSSETRRGRVGVGVAQTLDTQCNKAVWIGDFRSDEGLRIRQDGNSPAIMAMMKDTFKTNFTGNNPPITNAGGVKVRRLTPLECFRCQDFPDSHVENAKNVGISDSQLYKQAGNSITVRVLEKIIDKLNL